MSANSISIPITIKSDEKGYFDRECPNENCLFTFKINMKDWENTISDEEVYCPMCRHVDSSDKWWTQQQLDAIHEIASSWAISYAQEELGKCFKDLERSTRRNKFLKITYKPGSKVTFINNPLGQREEWEQEIQCSKCKTRYSVIGAAFFCPCCGTSGADNTFDECIDGIKKMINALPEMEELLEHEHGRDKAVSMCRAMLENSLGDVVSAFQAFADTKYASLSTKSVRANDFQIVEKGSTLFKEATGFGYDKWLDNDEIKIMGVMFQRRHILEHKSGIIDKTYIDKSDDTSYSVGQRLVVHKSDVFSLIETVKKLAQGLKNLA